jgi:hypothetical protein
MRARVPYLARLAQHAAGPAALRPPRQVFSGDTYTPGRSRDGDSSPRRRAITATAPSFPPALPPSVTGDEPLTLNGITSPRSQGAGAEPASGTPSATAGPTGPTSDTGTSPLPVASGGQAAAAGGGPGQAAAAGRAAPQAASRLPPDARTGSSQPAITAPATPANDGIVPNAAGTPPSGRARRAGDAAQARPPESWPSPPWGAPVDLPGTPQLAPAAGDAGRRAVAPSRSGPVTLPAEPGPVSSASQHQDRHAGDTDISATSGSRDTAAHQDRSQPPATVREFVPPAASAPPSSARPDPEPDDTRQKPRVPGRPRVSIGTIEVTVVPPAPPTPPAPEVRPPAPVVPGWSRPPSLLAASAGAGRLRDGIRRWYGTAQG